MRALTARLRPLSAFGSLIRGDTLFGQICWAIRHRFGEARLKALLEGYTEDAPFLVVSDAFPEGYLPRPALPLNSKFSDLPERDPTKRKEVKKKLWLPKEKFHASLRTWLKHCKHEKDIYGGPLWHSAPQAHNTINRLTGTTGEGIFTPRSQRRLWPHPELRLELYLLFDSERIGLEELEEALRHVGQFGYGPGASIGLGKFEVEEIKEGDLPSQEEDNAYLTLAPCDLSGMDLDYAFYQTFVRFGRHGDLFSQAASHPFKKPLLLAETAAVLKPKDFSPRPFVGRGLSGLSPLEPNTVHQGYAPALPIRLEVKEAQEKVEAT